MSQAAVSVVPDVDFLRTSAGFIEFAVKANVDGISQADSVLQPPAGNCLNWVVGHLANVYNSSLPLLGEQLVCEQEKLSRYARGSKPITDPSDALALQELLGIWNELTTRVRTGLNSLTPQQLDAPAPFSPTNNPNETVRSLLTTIMFHQAYHAGQLGLLRRLAGKNGAIA